MDVIKAKSCTYQKNEKSLSQRILRLEKLFVIFLLSLFFLFLGFLNLSYKLQIVLDGKDREPFILSQTKYHAQELKQNELEKQFGINMNDDISDIDKHLQHPESFVSQRKRKNTNDNRVKTSSPIEDSRTANRKSSLLKKDRKNSSDQMLKKSRLATDIPIGEIDYPDKVKYRKLLVESMNSSCVGKLCDQVSYCNTNPVLSAFTDHVYDERTARLLDIFKSLSLPELFQNPDTPQYKAACHLIHEDIVNNTHPNDYFIERYVLAVFLYSTHQDHEISRLLGTDTCQFQYFQCEEGYIQILHYRFMGFKGTIPSELAHIRGLEEIDLSGNSLSGTIPPELGRLKKLKRLIMARNHLTGTIPTDLGKLSNLELFILHNNNLEGSIPSEIGNLSRVFALYLFENNMIGRIPSEIGQLQNLQFLVLSDNNFEGTIPSELFHCTRLSHIHLFRNYLTGTLSSQIGNFQNLVEIGLLENQLVGQIPSEIGSLPNFRQLWLEKNMLTGSLPKEIGNLEFLEKLNVNDNQLNGKIPDIFGNFSGLVELHLSDNSFTGAIPISLWELDVSSSLLLENNDVTGTIPDEFCEYSDLPNKFMIDDSEWFIDPKVDCPCCGIKNECYMWESFDRTCPASNKFQFEFFYYLVIQDEVSNVSFSKNFSTVDSTQVELCLSPTGCYQIGYFSDETDYDADNLSFDEMRYSTSTSSLIRKERCDAIEMCGSIFDLSHAKRLGLNHLSQVVDFDLANVTNTESSKYEALCWILNEDKLFHDLQTCDGTLLQRFILVYFYFFHQLSIDFEELSSSHTCSWPGVTCDSSNKYVEHLDLSSKGLKGSIFEEIGLLIPLKSIVLSNNTLTGTIDASIYNILPNLEILDLSLNELEGNIPMDLMMKPTLKEINLSSNKLVGTLSNDIEYPMYLEAFNVGNNLLQGTIPPALGQCQFLERIDLSRNNFNGGIPFDDTLQRLKALKLNENRLGGSIPVEIFECTELQLLMLQSNELTGSIPLQIAQLENAKDIVLSNNALKGIIPSEMQKLNNLNTVHFHKNQLTGSAPQITFRNRTINTYISDCGNPSYLLPKPLECETCTMCCNSEGKCQETQDMKLNRWVAALLVIPFGISALMGCLDFPGRDPSKVFNANTVYSFILTTNMVAWAIHLITAISQFLLLSVFLRASRLEDDNTDWSFTYQCPKNGIQCKDESSRTVTGWIMFSLISISYLGADFSRSLMQLQMAVTSFDAQLFLSGLLLFSLTALAAFTSAIYNVALAESDTELIMNAVILLFINDLDEQIFYFLRSYCPKWTDDQLVEVQKYYDAKSYLRRRQSYVEESQDP